MEAEVTPPKKMKRKSEVEPLERPEGVAPSPLPDLPDDLKQKQDTMVRLPTPPKEPKLLNTPRGRVHAVGPSIPPSTKPKGMHHLTLNAPITTKVVCFSRLLKCLRSDFGKQCGPRSDCSYKSSLLWVHAVCFYT